MKNDRDPGLELEVLFRTQQAAFGREPYSDWATRAGHLRALDAMLRENRAAIVQAIHADFGNRAASETDIADMLGCHLGIQHALRHGRRWMTPERRSAGLMLMPARAQVIPQPIGVAGIIVPWNYPLFLAVGPLTGALAAGNRVMIKLSELTPQFGDLFARLIARTFAADHVTVINGEADIARAFSSLPFDHLLFTGSTSVGRQVMHAAAENLTPVTLELGGKSPALIGPGARFEQAVDAIVSGKLFNAGQTCVAPDYVMVPRGQAPAFLERAKAITAKLYPDFERNCDYTSIISARHFERLQRLASEAVARGATAHSLSAGDSDATARRFAPLVITGAPDDTPLMQDELFGPLLPLIEYDHLDDALAYINARPRALALYLFETDRRAIDATLARTHSGGVTINDTLLHVACEALPFGGVGPSGMGAYHGIDGFRTFSHMKPVLTQSRFTLRPMVYPPYGKRVGAIVKFFLK